MTKVALNGMIKMVIYTQGGNYEEKISYFYNCFGFGCMRLKMDGDIVDYDEFNRMIDAFIGAGFNYFDTAHGYIDGKSEIAIGKCLSARYNREDFVLANKLSDWYFPSESFSAESIS